MSEGEAAFWACIVIIALFGVPVAIAGIWFSPPKD